MKATFLSKCLCLFLILVSIGRSDDAVGRLLVSIKGAGEVPLFAKLSKSDELVELYLKESGDDWYVSGVPIGVYTLKLCPAVLSWSEQCYWYRRIHIHRGRNITTVRMPQSHLELTVTTGTWPMARSNWIVKIDGVPLRKNLYSWNGLADKKQKSSEFNIPFLESGLYRIQLLDNHDKTKTACAFMRVTAVDLRLGAKTVSIDISQIIDKEH